MAGELNNNVSLPRHQYGFVRAAFCNNLKPDVTGVVPAVIFGAESVPGRALTFHILRDDGALVSQVPIHALCWKEDAPQRCLSDLLRWDCFGWWLTVIQFDYLAEVTFEARIGDGVETGQYIATFDYLNNGYSEAPSQHKSFHWLALDDGNYALITNDKCKALERSFVERPFDWQALPKIERNKMKWFAED